MLGHNCLIISVCHMANTKLGVVIAKIGVALQFERSVNQHVRITEVQISDVLLYTYTMC